MEDIMKIVKSLKKLGILIKGVGETFGAKEKKKIEAKEEKGGFLGMLLGTLAASLIGSALAGKGVIRACEGVITAVQDF